MQAGTVASKIKGLIGVANSQITKKIKIMRRRIILL
jgi:hypothetical protein